jgi:uncharacterized membrane protein
LYDPYRPNPRPRTLPLLIVSIVVVLVAVVLLLVFLDWEGYFGTAPAGRSGGLFAYGFFPIFLVLLLVLFLVRIVFWSRMWGYRSNRNGYDRPHRDPAVMTVRQRYARGEINREQYDQLMAELGRRRSGP